MPDELPIVPDIIMSAISRVPIFLTLEEISLKLGNCPLKPVSIFCFISSNVPGKVLA